MFFKAYSIMGTSKRNMTNADTNHLYRKLLFICS